MDYWEEEGVGQPTVPIYTVVCRYFYGPGETGCFFVVDVKQTHPIYPKERKIRIYELDIEKHGKKQC